MKSTIKKIVTKRKITAITYCQIDVAVMLAMCHTLLIEGLHDQRFLDRYTTGFDRFAAYLRGDSDGTPKTAVWAAAISGMAAEDIVTLSRQMAAERTMLTVSWSLTRQQFGEQPFWAVVALAAMIGDMGKPGGGVGFGYTITNYLGNNVFKTLFQKQCFQSISNNVFKF